MRAPAEDAEPNDQRFDRSRQIRLHNNPFLKPFLEATNGSVIRRRVSDSHTTTACFLPGVTRMRTPGHPKPYHRRYCASFGHVCERFWGSPALQDLPGACRDPNQRNLRLHPAAAYSGAMRRKFYLTPKELNLLALMMKNPARSLVKRSFFACSVWGLRTWRRTGIPTHIRLHATEEDLKVIPRQARIYFEQAIGGVPLPQSGGFEVLLPDGAARPLSARPLL